MKLKKFATSALLALAGTALVAQSAQAQTTLSHNPGDLFLGIRATGGVGATKDLLIDIGSAASYRDGSMLSGNYVVALSLGNLNQDLVNTFGASWNTRTDVVWGIFGTPGASAVNGDAAKTLYGSAPDLTAGIHATPWNAGSSSGQGTVVSRMTAVEQAYDATAGTPNVSSTNGSVVLVQNTTDVNSYAFGATNPSAISFGFFNPSIEGAIGTQLDLFRMPVGFGTPGTYEGTFSLQSNGSVDFVPEPSSALLLGVGAMSLMARRRRQTSQA